jgi:hypothetical protein
MDYNLWQQLILGATKPFRTGANILAQNWGSALTGKDMSQQENQGRFLRWLSEGITPEEQQVINDKPYLSAVKSSAGMASTLAPFASQGLRTAQLAANPLTNRIAQLALQGALEGSLGGFGLSREGKEVQDTLTGGLAGAGGELFMDYLTNPQFRNMLTDATTTINPQTGARMYKGELGNNTVDPLDTLKQEARKYKSADEFVKAQTPVYHGGSGVKELSREFRIATPEEKLKFASSGGGYEGLSFSTDRGIAKNYSRNIGNTDEVFEGFINPNAKIKRMDLKGGTPDDLDLEALRRQGYDAIQDIGDKAEREFRALTERAIITKPQLEDIWKQARGLLRK